METSENIKFRLYNQKTGKTNIYSLADFIKGRLIFKGRFTGFKDRDNFEIFENDNLEVGNWIENHQRKRDGKEPIIRRGIVFFSKTDLTEKGEKHFPTKEIEATGLAGWCVRFEKDNTDILLAGYRIKDLKII